MSSPAAASPPAPNDGAGSRRQQQTTEVSASVSDASSSSTEPPESPPSQLLPLLQQPPHSQPPPTQPQPHVVRVASSPAEDDALSHEAWEADHRRRNLCRLYNSLIPTRRVIAFFVASVIWLTVCWLLLVVHLSVPSSWYLTFRRSGMALIVLGGLLLGHTIASLLFGTTTCFAYRLENIVFFFPRYLLSGIFGSHVIVVGLLCLFHAKAPETAFFLRMAIFLSFGFSVLLLLTVVLLEISHAPCLVLMGLTTCAALWVADHTLLTPTTAERQQSWLTTLLGLGVVLMLLCWQLSALFMDLYLERRRGYDGPSISPWVPFRTRFLRAVERGPFLVTGRNHQRRATAALNAPPKAREESNNRPFLWAAVGCFLLAAAPLGLALHSLELRREEYLPTSPSDAWTLQLLEAQVLQPGQQVAPRQRADAVKGRRLLLLPAPIEEDLADHHDYQQRGRKLTRREARLLHLTGEINEKATRWGREFESPDDIDTGFNEQYDQQEHLEIFLELGQNSERRKGKLRSAVPAAIISQANVQNNPANNNHLVSDGAGRLTQIGGSERDLAARLPIAAASLEERQTAPEKLVRRRRKETPLRIIGMEGKGYYKANPLPVQLPPLWDCYYSLKTMHLGIFGWSFGALVLGLVFVSPLVIRAVAIWVDHLGFAYMDPSNVNFVTDLPEPVINLKAPRPWWNSKEQRRKAEALVDRLKRITDEQYLRGDFSQCRPREKKITNDTE